MQSIGILYIATGQYTIFWEQFYRSFEKFFLPELEKHYYVFTDAKHLYADENERVHVIFQEALPWPLPTLLKFHYFLNIEEKLKQHDYLYQSNGPIVCVQEVKAEDFLPRVNSGEELFFTIHPGYVGKNRWKWPYDRNEESMAYVPYNRGKAYVFGAMNGGTASAYLQMMHILDSQIKTDLNHGIIARFHDESYINHYLLDCDCYRLLPASYAYPSGMEIADEKYIACVDKEKYLPIKQIKGLDTRKKPDVLMRLHRAFRKRYMYWEVLRDYIFRRKK